MTEPELPPAAGTTALQRIRTVERTGRDLDGNERRGYERRFLDQERWHVG